MSQSRGAISARTGGLRGMSTDADPRSVAHVRWLDLDNERMLRSQEVVIAGW